MRRLLVAGAQRAQGRSFRPGQDPVAVLCYHSIGAGEDGLCVTPRALGEQLGYLRGAGWEFARAHDLIPTSGQTRPSPRGRKRVLISFDDGYANLRTDALPILRAHGATALVFLHTNRSSERLGTDERLLTWDEIATLQRDGFDLGNHSDTHQRIDTDARAALELDRSEALFRKHCGHAPRIFAYPGGRPTEAVIRALRARNYDLAFTTEAHRGDPRAGWLTVPRITVDRQTTLLELRLRIERLTDVVGQALLGKRAPGSSAA